MKIAHKNGFIITIMPMEDLQFTHKLQFHGHKHHEATAAHKND